MATHKLKVGMIVTVEGKRVTLVNPLSDVDGSWEVSPPVGNPPLRFWNEDAMVLDDVGAQGEEVRREGTVERALEIAAHYHAGQRDKLGAPYILHPLRVAAAVAYHWNSREESVPSLGLDVPATIAAILHDVIEDTSVEAEDLLYEGFDADIVEAIKLLSRPAAGTPDRPTYRQFIERIRDAEGEPGRIARKVKMADLNDNIARIDSLPEEERSISKRYHRARGVLWGASSRVR